MSGNSIFRRQFPLFLQSCVLLALTEWEPRRQLPFKLHSAVTERAYSEYRDKVVEELGPRKDQSIRDKVVADQIANNPSPSQDVLVTGPGNVLCCELFTMRYFASDMEKLRRAQNDMNAKLLKHDYATFDDFYYIIGLRPTTTSGNLGWTSDKLMELIFSTALSDDGRPCITFEYNYTKTL